ncbi:hypothetical protein ACYUJ6_10375 [Clostridium sp. JNZ X4-2]
MEKRVDLKIWMIAKTTPAVFLVLYYWMCVRKYYSPVYTCLQYIVLGFILVSLYVVNKNRDVFDEYAKEVLGRTDTVCFKLSYVIFGFLIIPCLINDANPIVIGYGIVFGLLILAVIRSIVFCVLDSRGI